MDSRSFRFLHTADFRLDTPCLGVPQLSGDLRRLFIDARYAAAQRVFDAAIAHEVDFVVLAGALLDPQLPGLRGPLFLIQQIERLAKHGIKVYWAGATFLTHGRWPSHAPLPSNLRLFARGASSQIHERHARPVARLLSVDEDPVRPAASNLFTIALHPHCTTAFRGIDATVDYWALGGKSQRETHTLNGDVAHFPGSPQGRTPDEQGPHGCSIVEVDATGNVSIKLVATDIVRWCSEELTLSAHATWAKLKQQLEQRLSELRDELTATSLVEMAVINWTVSGSGLSMQRLMQPRFQQPLLNELNARQHPQAPALWSRRLDTVVDLHQLEDWQNEQTSLGAFLRELGQMSESLWTTHAPKTAPHEFTNRLRRQVVNEGIHRLGMEPVPH